jgi:MFS family permease
MTKKANWENVQMSGTGKPTDADQDHDRQLRRAALASVVGTTIEWYDFLLYGQVAALVFATLYFPKEDPLVGTLAAFATFAVGFIARPIGAAIFGH